MPMYSSGSPVSATSDKPPATAMMFSVRESRLNSAGVNRPSTSRTAHYPYAYRFTLDAVSCNPHTTSLSGGFQVASYSGIEKFGSKGFSYHHGGSWIVSGGEQFAEYMIFTNGLTDVQTDLVAAYLRKKWFGVDTPGYCDAAASNVTVASGATLRIVGGGTMTAQSLSVSGGSIEGDLTLSSGGELVVTVLPDGSVEPAQMDSAISLSGATIRFVGATQALSLGRHTLVQSAAISAGGMVACTVDRSNLRKRPYRILAEDGAIVLVVSEGGTTLQFR